MPQTDTATEARGGTEVTALWLALAAAAGFAAGHYRLPSRAFERLYDWSQDGRWHSGPIAFVMVAVAFLLTPRRTARNIRSWRRPERRQPAPEIDPRWGMRD